MPKEGVDQGEASGPSRAATVRAAIAVILRETGDVDTVTSGENRVEASDAAGAGGATLEVLVTQRPEGTPKAGYWEFPGGKIEAGESGRACVVREVREEVGLRVEPFHRLPDVRHVYEHAAVELEIWVCRQSDHAEQARPIEVRDARWVGLDELPVPGFLEGNGAIITSLRAWAEGRDESGH